MTAIHLHFKSDVGTTYKRALKRIHLSRDAVIPGDFRLLSLIDELDNWSALTTYLEDGPLRKPRDFDAELKALDDKAKKLRQRKVVQLGELVIATGADALPIELLAGALLAASDTADMVVKEKWRARGAAFFRRTSRKDSSGARRYSLGGEARHSGPPSPSGEAGTS